MSISSREEYEVSAPIRITSPDEIRKGDLIRIEAMKGENRTVRAVEYVAGGRGDLPKSWEYTFTEWQERVVLLLERQITLPTELWSMLTPPSGSRLLPYVLAPHANDGVGWLCGSRRASTGEVAEALANGWTVRRAVECASDEGNADADDADDADDWG